MKYQPKLTHAATVQMASIETKPASDGSEGQPWPSSAPVSLLGGDGGVGAGEMLSCGTPTWNRGGRSGASSGGEAVPNRIKLRSASLHSLFCSGRSRNHQ